MREKVEATARRAVSLARKKRCHDNAGGVCWMCSKPVEVSGPTVDYDHFIPVWTGGADDDHNLKPLCHSPCHKIKTAADAAKRAKVKRLIAREDGTKKPGKQIASRGFDRTRTRGFDGKVRDRK